MSISEGLRPGTEAGDGRIADRDRGPPALESGNKDLIASKITDLRHYDVLGIDRVAAICCWGRSGSYLLASLLDGHDDVIMLPTSVGQFIYRFWEKYQHLSLREKLLAYPRFVEQQMPDPVFGNIRYNDGFFRGEFRIDQSDYDAAVAALLAVYGGQPGEVLESRSTFLRFLVVAYNLALGRRPANPRPMIIHPQHIWSNASARQLIADFPRCRFIHAVRDPISCLDSTFEHGVKLLNDSEFLAALEDRAYEEHRKHNYRFNYPAWKAFWSLIWRDGFHAGLEDRSIFVRFEDVHAQPRQTMGRIARWLGLSEGPVLLNSTFNGKPWIVESAGQTWTGTRPGQVRRRARHLSWVDRSVVFALFQENFEAWSYPYPRFFASRWGRAVCIGLILAVPMRSELASDLIMMRTLLLPALRNAKLGVAAGTVWRTLLARIGLRAVIFIELCRRVTVTRLAKPI